MTSPLRRSTATTVLFCTWLWAAAAIAAPGNGAAPDMSPFAPATAEERSPALSPEAPIPYPDGSLHSPMTHGIVNHLRAVLARGAGHKDVFVKIGDSNTVNTSFMSCFAGEDVRLDSHAPLAPTLEFFGARRVDGVRTSFDRVTRAATVGWLAGNVLAGDPAPLSVEIEAMKPAFAVIMLGTNDNRPGGIEPFAHNLREIVDSTLALGVVPLLSTIPPRADSPAAAARVPEINAIIRDIAETRRIPLMDLYSALLPLRNHGLAADGIHLQMAGRSAPHGCWLTPEALRHGMNARNLLALTALDRARRFLLDGETPEPS